MFKRMDSPDSVWFNSKRKYGGRAFEKINKGGARKSAELQCRVKRRVAIAVFASVLL